jgi:hypothetical protein
MNEMNNDGDAPATCTVFIAGRSYVIVTKQYLWERVNDALYKISRDGALAKQFRTETKKVKHVSSAFIFSFAWKHSLRGSVAKRSNKLYRKQRPWFNWHKL